VFSHEAIVTYSSAVFGSLAVELAALVRDLGQCAATLTGVDCLHTPLGNVDKMFHT